MRRTLQVTMLIVAAIPLVMGAINFSLGASHFVPVEHINANLDNQLRFYAVWFTVVFFLTIWCVRNLEIAGPVMKIMFVTMALGGAARVFSMTQFGLPDPPMIVGAAIEISVLAFLPWHAAVVRRSRAAPA